MLRLTRNTLVDIFVVVLVVLVLVVVVYNSHIDREMDNQPVQ
jgi:Tfp pilus assembly protein PilE